MVIRQNKYLRASRICIASTFQSWGSRTQLHQQTSILQALTRHVSMVDLNVQTLSQLPNEMRIFSLISTTARNGPRLGKLSLPTKSNIQTPHYVGNTSRGAIPHLTQDMQCANSTTKALYMALEDCK